jgi:hypothetical protein
MNTSYTGQEAPRLGAPVAVEGPTRDPIRAVGRPNFRTKFNSLLNGRLLHCESLLEHQALKLFEVAPGVERFTEQPEPLTIRMGRPTRSRRYTPDILVTWKNSAPWLVEVKPSALARTPLWREKIKAAALAAAARGFHFVVITEQHVAMARLAGIEDVLTRRHRRHVEGLGGPPASLDEISDKEVEKTVLEVLATVLDESPSLGALQMLGVALAHNQPSRWWSDVGARGPRRPRAPMRTARTSVINEAAK